MKKILIFLVTIISLNNIYAQNANEPRIYLDSIKDVSYDRASCYSFIENITNAFNVQEVGIIVSENSTPDKDNGIKILDNNRGEGFHSLITNKNNTYIKSNTTYYAVAYISNIQGKHIYSNILSFNTRKVIPPKISISINDDLVATKYATAKITVSDKNDAESNFFLNYYLYSENPNPEYGKPGVTTLPNSKLDYQSDFPQNFNVKLENLKHNTKYYLRTLNLYTLTNTNKKIDTVYSDVITFTTKHICGYIPENIKVYEKTENSISITWNAGEYQTLWDVDYGIIGHAPGTGTIRTVGKDSITIVNLLPGKRYTIFVRASCEDKNSGWSPDFPVTTNPLKCAPVYGLIAKPITNSTASISWTPGAPSQSKWEYSLAKLNNSYPTYNTPTENTYFYSFGLEAETAYKARVRAICDDYVSDWQELKFLTSKNSGIEILDPNSDKILIYPNPTTGVINFRTENKNISKIEIWNNLGEVIYSSEILPESYSLQGQSKGMFLVKIYSYRGIQIEKIILK